LVIAPRRSLSPGREFGGDETEEGHQATGRVEAHEVVELRHESHGGEGVDAAEAAQGPDRLGVGGLLARCFDVLLEPA
jgi:hypothetical protein